MIKTILVPTSGSSTDQSVFATALAVARPLTAHLEFLRERVFGGVTHTLLEHADMPVFMLQ